MDLVTLIGRKLVRDQVLVLLQLWVDEEAVIVVVLGTVWRIGSAPVECRGRIIERDGLRRHGLVVRLVAERRAVFCPRYKLVDLVLRQATIGGKLLAVSARHPRGHASALDRVSQCGGLAAGLLVRRQREGTDALGCVATRAALGDDWLNVSIPSRAVIGRLHLGKRWFVRAAEA
jgi:hypothetical protein